jgi:aminopeptidase 2
MAFTAIENSMMPLTLHGMALPAGSTIQLTIVYQGNTSDVNDPTSGGIIWAPYKASDGSMSSYIVTQGEATEMRRVLPCLDDPALKANFTLALIVNSTLTALSNMAVSSEVPVDGGKKKVSFRTSPPMSTYLIAFSVGPLKHVESTHYRVPVRWYAPTDWPIEASQWAIDVAADGLKAFEGGLGVRLPLEKVDFVGVSGLGWGGMENWGLVTMGAGDFIGDRETHDAGFSDNVVMVILHELAHHWFGDLVTCRAWGEIWLNEGL